MKIEKNAERKFRQSTSLKTGEKYSLSSVISETLGLKDFFMSYEIIAPNSRSSAPHFHKKTDEIIFVISGRLKAVENGLEVIVSAGDTLLFECNSGHFHFLKNDFENDAQVLVIRKKIAEDDAVFPNI